MDVKKIKILSFIFLLSCAFLILIVTNENYYDHTFGFFNTIRVLMIVMITAFYISILVLISYSLTNNYLKRLSKDYEKQIHVQSEHYMQLANATQELRCFKHDYNNMRLGITELIREDRIIEALMFLENQKIEIRTSILKYDTGNGIVDALLSDKQNQTDKINTTIKFEGAVPGNAIDAVDLCIIFGNPLDNAIEACAEIDADVSKEIHISCVCNSGFAFIEITNPVQKKVEIRGNLPETTKPDKEMHGFGLYSLEKAIKKYDGEVTCECDETIFKLSMELSIPVKEF